MIRCQKCGTENEELHEFCHQCGEKIKKIKCEECGTLVGPEVLYCPKCGSRISEIPLTDEEKEAGRLPKANKPRKVIYIIAKVLSIVLALCFIAAFILPVTTVTYGDQSTSLGILNFLEQPFFDSLATLFSTGLFEDIVRGLYDVAMLATTAILLILTAVFGIMSIVKNSIQLAKPTKDTSNKEFYYAFGCYLAFVFAFTLYTGGIYFGENTTNFFSLYSLIIVGVTFVASFTFAILKIIFARDKDNIKTVFGFALKTLGFFASIAGYFFLVGPLLVIGDSPFSITNFYLSLYVANPAGSMLSALFAILSIIFVAVFASRASARLYAPTYKNRGFIGNIVKELVFTILYVGLAIAIYLIPISEGQTDPNGELNLLFIIGAGLIVVSFIVSLIGHILCKKRKTVIIYLK